MIREGKDLPELKDLEQEYENDQFGAYLRCVRQAKQISIRQMAKAVNKTAAYLSDIENGNNKPPDKELLEMMIGVLQLEGHPAIREHLFDLAARERNDIPADVKEYVIQNKTLLKILRAAMENPNGEQIWARIAESL